MSGQSVSITKSRVYFSHNVDRDTRESLCDILGLHPRLLLVNTMDFPSSIRVSPLMILILS